MFDTYYAQQEAWYEMQTNEDYIREKFAGMDDPYAGLEEYEEEDGGTCDSHVMAYRHHAWCESIRAADRAYWH